MNSQKPGHEGARFEIATMKIKGNRTWGIVQKERNIFVDAGYRDENEYWNVAMSEPMEAIKFLEFLFGHMCGPLMDPPNQQNRLLEMEIRKAFNLARSIGVPWIINNRLVSDDRSGNLELKHLMVYPRAAAEWLLSLPKQKHLVPVGLQVFLGAALPAGTDPKVIAESQTADLGKYHGLFLSHTAADKPFVRQLREDLRARGVLQVWMDEAEIEVGDSLAAKIDEGMKLCRYIGVVLSSQSINSSWVKKELDIAINREIEGGEVVVLPLLYETCELPAFLKGKLYADFTSQDSREDALAKLLRRLRIK